jgi:hypothetical protein
MCTHVTTLPEKHLFSLHCSTFCGDFQALVVYGIMPALASLQGAPKQQLNHMIW